MMRPIVEFCQTNLASGTQRVKEELEKDSNIDVVEYDCLGYCVDCAAYPYALVNGKIVTGKSTKDLLNKIRAEIERQEEEMLS
ncbi:DUF1450 domain-containing protein [Caldalkalibacillus thermarum]|uniref:DUF1450 domain-containing protein n=1 Tax=Caldalkalibacillus thermarum TaxID=296745 RepID=UPI00166CE188|nr:DUF1450 domain-containing protein [Caldalkalibacillus thermarum]